MCSLSREQKPRSCPSGSTGNWLAKGEGKGVNSEKKKQEGASNGKTKKRRATRVEGRRVARIEAGSESNERANRRHKTGQSPAGSDSGSHFDGSWAGGGPQPRGSGSDGETLQCAWAGGLGDRSRAWPQAEVYERAAGARADRSATRAGSRKGSDGHLVAAAATGCSAQDRSSPDRYRNDSGGAA